MSHNYGPNTSPGDIRRRAFRIEVEAPNQLETGNPASSLTYHEEDAVLLADATEKRVGPQPVASTQVPYDPSVEIPVRDPETDQPIPGMVITGAQFYAFLYSVVRKYQDDNNL